jgi:hypothetical protein
MGYISKASSTPNVIRDNQLYREWQEQQPDEDKTATTTENVEPESIRTVFSQLDRYTVDGPSQQATAVLLALAASYATLPEQEVTEPSPKRMARLDERPVQQQSAVALSLPVRLMQAMAVQARTLHALFWLISALVAGAGAAIQWLAVAKSFAIPGLSAIFLSTVLLLSVASVAYSLRSMHTPMSELETTFPVTPIQLMVARIGTILIYDLFLALLFTGLLVMTGTSGEFGVHATVRVIDLLLLLCLSTFAALTAMLRFGTWPGTIIVLTIGVLQFVAGDRLGVFQLFGAYGSTHWLASKLIAAALTITLGICTCLLLRHRHYYKHQEQEG